MQQIFNFFIKNKTFLWFLLLFIIALSFTIQSHSYHKSKFINSANFLSGGLYGWTANINQYFNLKSENDLLLEDNAKLKKLLFNTSEESIDSSKIKDEKYIITAGKVYKNDYSATNNYLLINKGTNDSLKEDLGVITSKGILGVIDKTSKKYARVLSILNTNSRINAQLKKSNHFGSLTWNTKSPQFVQLIDVPNFAPVAKGDTIITGGRSQIFPKGIGIGIVDSFNEDASGDSYSIQVKLFNDMTNLGHAYVIKNKDANEITNLMQLQDE